MTSAVVVMARAPRPGRCKTRLEPLLGPYGCARLQAALIEHTVALAHNGGLRPVLIAFDPPDARSAFARLERPGIELVPQVPGVLGSRIAAAVADAFARYGAPVIALGTDSPLLSAGHLAAAEAALAEGSDACMIPATDGGYALLGLRRFDPTVFALPPAAWGGPEVRRLTLAALRRAGMSVGLFDAIDDLDTPDDARRLARHPGCPARVRPLLAARAAA